MFRDAASKSEFCNLTIQLKPPYDVIPKASLKDLIYHQIRYMQTIFTLEKWCLPKYVVWSLHKKWNSQLYGVSTLFSTVFFTWQQNHSRQWGTKVCLQNFLCWWKYDFYIMISKTVGREVKTRTWCNFYNNYRVSHIIGPTLFFCNFSGSGAPTEELFTIFQQPWKFATL